MWHRRAGHIPHVLPAQKQNLVPPVENERTGQSSSHSPTPSSTSTSTYVINLYFTTRGAEKLANHEHRLDIFKNHFLRADDNPDELNKLNRSIFRPAIAFDEDAKRAVREANIQARYEEDREEHERGLAGVRKSQNTLGQRLRMDVARGKDSSVRRNRTRGRGRGTSPGPLSHELDDNLNEISYVTKRLKAFGMAVGQEPDPQNSALIGSVTRPSS